jgi:hypothetical protein
LCIGQCISDAGKVKSEHSGYWALADIASRIADTDPRGKAEIAAQPTPACRTVAVNPPPAEESAFIVNLIAATGVVKLP